MIITPKPVALPAIIAITLSLSACAKNAIKSGGGTVAGTAAAPLAAAPKAGKKGPQIGNPGEGTLYVAPGLDSSKRKTLPLLKSSIKTCLDVDDSIFEVAPAMMAERDARVSADEQGRVAFLPARYDVVEEGKPPLKSVLDIEKSFLDDPASLRRASVYGSSLDDLTYMIATQTVANVVAWNIDTEKLDCEGTAAARELLDRCLLGEEDAILAEAATHLGADKACGSSDKFNKRKAIATFLASYLFLRVR
jgi:hypothetical protein